MSSDMRSDSWAASVKQILTRPSEARLAEVAGTLPPRALPRVPRVEREPHLPSAARKESGLRARLQIRRCRGRRWRMGGRGNPPPAPHHDGSSVGCASCRRSRDSDRHANTWLVPVAPVCAAWPGDGTDRHRRGGGRRRPRVAPRRWKPELRRRHPRCRVVHSRLDGVPLDVPPVAPCAAGPGAVPPGTRHDREPTTTPWPCGRCCTRSRSSDMKCGELSEIPGVIRTGQICRAAPSSISFQR